MGLAFGGGDGVTWPPAPQRAAPRISSSNSFLPWRSRARFLFRSEIVSRGQGGSQYFGAEMIGRPGAAGQEIGIFYACFATFSGEYSGDVPSALG